MPRARGGYPTEMEEVLRTQVNALRADLAETRTRLNDLVAKYNAHTHVENTAAAYTQNATTAAPPVGSQATAASAATATEDVTRY